jgi:hypothetical protein
MSYPSNILSRWALIYLTMNRCVSSGQEGAIPEHYTNFSQPIVAESLKMAEFCLVSP